MTGVIEAGEVYIVVGHRGRPTLWPKKIAPATMLAMTMAMGFMKSMSTHGTDSGRCCVPGCACILASRKKIAVVLGLFEFAHNT